MKRRLHPRWSSALPSVDWANECSAQTQPRSRVLERYRSVLDEENDQSISKLEGITFDKNGFAWIEEGSEIFNYVTYSGKQGYEDESKIFTWKDLLTILKQ